MRPAARDAVTGGARPWLSLWMWSLPLLCAALAWLAARSVTAAHAAEPATAAAPAESGPRWPALNATQQQALAPLEPAWSSIDAPRKRKWLEVADRFPRMPADERLRVQERMAAWSAMSPNERARARVQFQETRLIGAEQRQARWQAYQALPEEERKRLAQAAVAKKPVAAASAAAPSGAARAETAGEKHNLVAATPSPAPRSVAPTVVQAKPGASTTTVATTAKPPLHHQPGLPKIVATPGFVDPTTLLPKRGAQAAAMRTAASRDPAQQP